MKRNVLFWICIVLLVIVLLFSGFQLIQEVAEYRKGEKTYEDLSQFVQFETEPPQTRPSVSGTEETTEPEVDPIPVVDFESLCARNGDTVGWIYIPGTNVSYPIVRAADNDYYLYRLFDGTVNSSGSIFMDYKNDETWQDRHTVIYGHNMKNGTMFANILDYNDQSYYDAHPTGYLLTPQGDFEIVFFAGYVADPTEPGEDAWQMNFEDNDAYLKWLRHAGTRSTFLSQWIPGVQDRVITLSTCSYAYDDARYVLHGILKPMDN